MKPSRFPRRSAASCSYVVAVTIAILLFSIPASAQLSSEEAGCRNAIAKSAGKYSKLALKTIEKCHKLRNKGTLGIGVDCNDLVVADLNLKAAKAADKFREAVGGAKDKCEVAGTPMASVLAEFGRCPSPAAAIDDGGVTTGIDDFSELAECVIEHTRLLTEENAVKTMGLPVALSADAIKCHGTIGKSATKVMTTIVKDRASCQKALDKTAVGVGFDCATADGKNKIAGAIAKSKAKIVSVCEAAAANPLSRARGARALGDLDSCADTVDGLADCVVDESASLVGAGIASMLWELPGICPGSGSYSVIPVVTGAEFDIGWSGLAHDMDPILGYRGARFAISCDADCDSCVNAGPPEPPTGACRCNNDPTLVCTASGADPACGGGTCQCFYGPPAPFVAGSSPVCLTTEIDGTLGGSFDPPTGSIVLDIPARVRIYLGWSLSNPCPLCEAGVCSGGDRDGLTCSVDGTDATFGSVSFDCPPTAATNISGGGIITDASFTTGSVSLDFDTACDFPLPPPPAFTCACAVCSLDATVACRSDADCTGIGLCDSSGSSGNRRPNSCDDLVCTPDPASSDPSEGICLSGPFDSYCDGFVRSNGGGIAGCFDNNDCLAVGPACPGGDCGNCTLVQARNCFVDPIAAQGVDGGKMVGVGCIGASSSTVINLVAGFPGPQRIQQNIGGGEVLCSDGVTPFIPPGGSNCP